MKKNDIDLSILGTGKDTAGRLADEFTVPEEGKEKIFRQSLKKHRQGGSTPSGDSVQGVEKYRRPVWSRIAAAAAIVAVAAGGTGTGLLMLHGHNASVPGTETTEATEATEEATEAPTEESTEAYTEAPTEAPIDEPTESSVEAPDDTLTEDFRELEILSSEKKIMTHEEHSDMIFAAMEDYKQNGPSRLDRDKYIAQFRAAEDTEALNTPELKSYIYDMTLNSLHYFDTLSGHHSYISTGNVIEADFGFDQVNSYAWEHLWRTRNDEDTGSSTSVYNYDGLIYHVDNSSMKYRTSVSGLGGDGINLGTNDWLVLNTEGENMSTIQPDPSMLGFASNTGFAPQFAQSHLNDLSAWQILSVTEVNGMECAEIEGDWWKGHFKLYIDLHHGFLMKYDNSDGDHYELTDLRIDEPVEKKTFDPTGYSGKDVFGKPVH